MRLEMKNWLCYSSSVTTFAPGVHLICGPNGAGKSSVLDAVRWCLTGYARGIEKLGEASVFRSDPAKPMSVSLEFEQRSPGWPSAVTRGSKLAIVPSDVERPYKERADHIDTCLGTWEFLKRSDGDRAAFLAALQRFTIDPEVLAAEIKRACGFTAPKQGRYNDLPWGPWESVASALSQAEAIRRSYAAATKGPGSDYETRIAQMKADLRDAGTVPRPDEPTGIPTVQELEARYNAKVVTVARLSFLGQQLQDLEALLVGDEFASARTVLAQFVTDRVTVPSDAERRAVEDINRQCESGKRTWDAYNAKLKAHETNVAMRQRLSEALLAVEREFDAKTKAASDAAVRRGSWDKICTALKPDGAVSSALTSMATRAIDLDRLSWATDLLGVRVAIGADGGVQVQGRSSSQPSRGEQLLAALALQDAACMLAEVPVMLIDELEALDPACLSKALSFLTAAAEDYAAIICCRTTGPVLPANWRPEGVKLWTANRGALVAV